MSRDLSPQVRISLIRALFHLVRADPGELSEILHTDSQAVDVLCTSLSKHFLDTQLQIRQLVADSAYLKQQGYDPRLLTPKVTASCVLHGQKMAVNEFDATLWFVLASDDELTALQKDNDEEGEVAVSIAELAAAYEAEVQTLLDYHDISSERKGLGFTCHVNQEEMNAWLAIHRPHLLLEEEK